MQDRRALVLTRLIAGKIEQAEAALLLGLSARSIRRLRARYIERGPASLNHGNRGRPPAHALAPSLVRRVVALAKTTYGIIGVKVWIFKGEMTKARSRRRPQ